jgi:tetratricopeptide (TPR) repeat protein
MKLTNLIFISFLLLTNLHVAAAQETHQHKHEMGEQVGRVNFKISCSAKMQSQFNRAVAWLHSFEYEAAEREFTQIANADPQCGMAYWGIAMSNYHPLWAPPTPDELKKGASAVERANVAGAQTERERNYIAAITIFFKDPDRVDHRTRSTAYSEAMKRLYEQNQTDHESAVFYALSLIAAGMMTPDKTYAKEKEAAQILNRVLASEPQHPGVTHYLIHSYDYPALAELALPAARSYAKIAPASAHAQHMPSHIFTRLGLWQEAIKSNIDARASAIAFATKHKMSGAYDEQLHAMDYLAYAYLQGAQDKQALVVLQELNKIRQVDPPSFKVAYAFAAIPARYALERRQWAEAAKLSLQPGTVTNLTWDNFRWAEAYLHLARAVGSARTGDATTARAEVEQLKAIHEQLREVKGGYDWAKQIEIQGKIAEAWLAFAEKKSDDAIAAMRAAADLDDATEKHPVTPGSVLPAREQLGELLIELKQPREALREFEVSFRSAPNRFNGWYGAARAARLADDQKTARMYYTKLIELCTHADTVRPELEEAKEFVARK